MTPSEGPSFRDSRVANYTTLLHIYYIKNFEVFKEPDKRIELLLYRLQGDCFTIKLVRLMPGRASRIHNLANAVTISRTKCRDNINFIGGI